MTLRDMLDSAFSKKGFEPSYLEHTEQKDDVVVAKIAIPGYPPMKPYRKAPVCKYKENEKSIIVSNAFSPVGLKIKAVKSSKTSHKLHVGDLDDSQLFTLLDQLIDWAIDGFTSERFSCCSRYEECSAARYCVHPDKLYSSGCSYRGNLEKGHIFYGPNRNSQ